MLVTNAPIVLVGHSHIALALAWDGTTVEGGLARSETVVETPGARWLLNPGSVGQPRDGDARAAWLLIDIAGRAGNLPAGSVCDRADAGRDACGGPAGGARLATRGGNVR